MQTITLHLDAHQDGQDRHVADFSPQEVGQAIQQSIGLLEKGFEVELERVVMSERRHLLFAGSLEDIQKKHCEYPNAEEIRRQLHEKM